MAEQKVSEQSQQNPQVTPQPRPDTGRAASSLDERSETIGKLIAALCQFAAECPPIVKDKVNPYFSTRDNPALYADLDSVISAVRPALAKHGLFVWQGASTDLSRSVAIVKTVVAHTSGEFMANTIEMPAKKADSQALGAAVTYARRYGLQGAIFVAGEPDDDGNAASDKTNNTQAIRQGASSDSDSLPSATVLNLKNAVHCKVMGDICRANNITGADKADLARWAGGKTIAQFHERAKKLASAAAHRAARAPQTHESEIENLRTQVKQAMRDNSSDGTLLLALEKKTGIASVEDVDRCRAPELEEALTILSF